MVDLHPIKKESFHTAEQLNIDPKGFHRPVDRFLEFNGCLFMARQAPDHPRFHYMESWLIPTLNLRVTKFHFHEDVAPDQDLYVDIARITVDGDIWYTEDLYVDFVTYSRSSIDTLDLDELGAALKAGYISVEDADLALRVSQELLTGVRRTGSVESWLEHCGFRLSWS